MTTPASFDPDRPSAREAYGRGNVAMLYFTASQDPSWLDVAVYHLLLAVRLGDLDPSTHVRAQFQLGQTLMIRFQRSGRREDLEAGAQNLVTAAVDTPADHPHRSWRYNSAAQALLTVVEHFTIGEAPQLAASHLQSVINAMDDCLSRASADDPLAAWYLSNMGLAYWHRHEHTGNEEDLVTAVEHMRTALSRAQPDDPEQLAAFLGNLGITLLSCFTNTGDPSQLSESLALLRQAIEVSPPHSPDHGGHLKNLAVALARSDEPDASVDQAFQRAESATSGSFEVDNRYLTIQARRASDRGNWPEAARLLGIAERSLTRVLSVQISWRHKTRLLYSSSLLTGEVAYAKVMAGDRLGALESLELGRTRLIDDAFRLATLDPEQVRAAGHPDLADQIAQALWDVRYDEIGMRDPSSAHFELGGEGERLQRDHLERLVAQARRLPNLHDFGQPRAEAPARRALPRLLVYLVTTYAGGMALLVRPEQPEDPVVVPLPELTYRAVAERVSAVDSAHAVRTADQHRWLTTLDQTCRWLWDAAMSQVIGAARQVGAAELTLVACGGTALLPLHAAWTEDLLAPTGRRYVLDELAVSYVPSSRLFASAADRSLPHGLLDRPLIVVSPQPQPPGYPPLTDTRAEADEIRRFAPTGTTLTGPGATPENVLRELGDCSLAHLACHGSSAPGQSLKSKLILSGGELTVHDLLDRGLGRTRLVVLSACETARIGRDLPDELIGLPAALLRAGATGVIASLWTVPDPATAILMRQFYRELTDPTVSPAVALQRSQRTLRDATNSELIANGLRDGSEAAHLGPVAHRLWEAARPFTHPYTWAAFTYTGC